MTDTDNNNFENIKRLMKLDSVKFHMRTPAGKLQVIPSKDISTEQALSLAYSPGVADACKAISYDNTLASKMTSRGNLVGVISNGTAVLGLGNLGPLASKPVMEGKAAIFKQMADIDSFDIEINQTDPHKLAEIITALAPTFGGINLEDIKSPECFTVEEIVSKNVDIPVMHDDQHGTAIVICAALVNALRVQNKKIDDIRIVFSGAGAAAIATAKMLCTIGVKHENIYLNDNKGIVSIIRPAGANKWQEPYARNDDSVVNIQQALVDADVLIGLSVGNIISGEDLSKMARNPVVFALANPVPEISRNDVIKARPDAIYASGRSDDMNQVNNLLCFPFLFRGALDSAAKVITPNMKSACISAIADIVLNDLPDNVTDANRCNVILIPKFNNPILRCNVPYAVFKAAQDDNVARTDISLDKYKENLLNRFFKFQSKLEVMPQSSTSKESVILAGGVNEVQALRSISKVCNVINVLDDNVNIDNDVNLKYLCDTEGIDIRTAQSAMALGIGMLLNGIANKCLITGYGFDEYVSFIANTNNISKSKMAYVATYKRSLFVVVNDDSLLDWAQSKAEENNLPFKHHKGLFKLESDGLCYIVHKSDIHKYAEGIASFVERIWLITFINEEKIIINTDSKDVNTIKDILTQ